MSDDRLTDAIVEMMTMYDKEISGFALNAWVTQLSRYPVESVLAALSQYISTPEKCRFAPMPGDIVEILDGSKDDRKAAAGLAYARAFDAISSYGSYASVVFDDPAIMYAVQCGFSNWVGFCQAEHHDFDRKKFIDEYTNYRDGLPFPKCLEGITAIGNGSQFPEFNKVSAIGDVERCRAVYRKGRDILDISKSMPVGDFIPAMKPALAA